MLGNKSRKQNYRDGGTRGGQDQFKWEDVKNDRERENYLGSSLHAPTGRWQKGKDLLWYTRTGSSDKTKELEEERERARQIDEERLNEALGIKPIRGGENRGGGGGRGGGGTHSLNDAELKQLLSRGSTERSALDGERVAGLGAAPAFLHDHLTRITAIQAEINRLKEANSKTGDATDDREKKRKRDERYNGSNSEDNSSRSSSSDSDSSDSDSGNDKMSNHKHKKDRSRSDKDGDNDDAGVGNRSKKSKKHKEKKDKKKHKKDKKKNHRSDKKSSKSSKDKR